MSLVLICKLLNERENQMANYQKLLFERDGAITTITFNRPEPTTP